LKAGAENIILMICLSLFNDLDLPADTV